MDFLHFSTWRAFASVGGDVRSAISRGKSPAQSRRICPSLEEMMLTLKPMLVSGSSNSM